MLKWSVYFIQFLITREQIAAILYRYAGRKACDVSLRQELDSYADEEMISEYAREAMSWSNAEGLITGRDGNLLAPGEHATRAEVATILVRFCDIVSPDAGRISDCRILRQLTVEEKVDQLFILTPEALLGRFSSVTGAGNAMRTALTNHPVGGLIFFAGNLKDPAQTRSMLSAIHSYAMERQGLPPLLCVDEEGGRVVRIANKKAYGVYNVGSMKTMKNEGSAYNAGAYIGSYLRDLGFTVDFAPVADVLSVSGSTVIGDRSFGSDPYRVSSMAKAYSDGLHAQGILSTYKHFPGHGATAADTHKGFAYTSKSLEQLMQSDMIPYKEAQAAGIDAVMVAHVSVPGVTGSSVPSSLSGTVITGILRNRLGYQGLVVTDSLSMGAITQSYSASNAAVMAVEAGVDLLLMPEDFNAARNGVLNAVSRGEITMARLDQSVLRIIHAKSGIVQR